MGTIFNHNKIACLCIVASTSFMCTSANSANFDGPDSVESTIAQQKKQQLSWREKLSSNGFNFGADYFALGLTSPNGSDGHSVNASSGVARFYVLGIYLIKAVRKVVAWFGK